MLIRLYKYKRPFSIAGLLLLLASVAGLITFGVINDGGL